MSDKSPEETRPDPAARHAVVNVVLEMLPPGQRPTSTNGARRVATTRADNFLGLLAQRGYEVRATPPVDAPAPEGTAEWRWKVKWGDMGGASVSGRADDRDSALAAAGGYVKDVTARFDSVEARGPYTLTMETRTVTPWTPAAAAPEGPRGPAFDAFCPHCGDAITEDECRICDSPAGPADEGGAA